MTKIAIQPNAAGTGTFTIEAPNSNSNRTLTLPDAAGELLTDVSSLPAANLTGDVAAARITNALNAGGSAPIYACRAWVSINGGSPATIRASGNVSSVTRTAVGKYTVNFANSMPDTNYAAHCSSIRSASDGTASDLEAINTGSVDVSIIRPSTGTFQDPSIICVAIFR
jgi:hypothetical protein